MQLLFWAPFSTGTPGEKGCWLGVWPPAIVSVRPGIDFPQILTKSNGLFILS